MEFPASSERSEFSLANIARRDGDPSTWDEPEHGFEVVERILASLEIDRDNEEIRAAAFTEADRQMADFQNWREKQNAVENELAYKKRMGSIATGLVDTFLPEGVDPDARSRKIDEVLDVLRPLDERISILELDRTPHIYG